ncbi:delta-1-pyrroline-5-carboxylate dehydrogenase, mitochondrial [Diaphorina citri]|uniref:L-glutamate gamma-semialdehyde dehydrogenase n=1 Tax=Diaphorina citri TaxID=121845 RepID=A0A3Q0J968_DIACI|nr:delta-1-pyrroline-5-carboxylate dehydrogenase, mitochondrial [Diaphorina citri]
MGCLPVERLDHYTTYLILDITPSAYLPGSKEREAITAALKRVGSTVEEVPIVIGSKEYKTEHVQYQPMPHNHKKKIAKFYYATPVVENALNAFFAKELTKYQPISEDPKSTLNCLCLDDLKYAAGNYYINDKSTGSVVGQQPFGGGRMSALTFYLEVLASNLGRGEGLDGFVAAVSPFNFTAIGGNLAYTPALMGSSVLWKPSDTALLSNYTIYKIMIEAGVPPGVVNFVPADGPVFGDTITASPYLAGINFTGSVPTFNRLWLQVGKNINVYKNFPRLIGECGGKNFHFIHASANVESVVNGTIRSAFEYCGQKCSACSRMYVPESLFCFCSCFLLLFLFSASVPVFCFCSCFLLLFLFSTSVPVFCFCSCFLLLFLFSASVPVFCFCVCMSEIIGGGQYDESCGYFIQPTIVQTKDPLEKIMTEEIFGPVLTIFVYPDKDLDKTLKIVTDSTPYALTGAVFAEDESFQKRCLDDLKYAAGNYYINDKSTGSVVGQQPFGGGRMSGTNDKAGGPHYVLRWATPQSIKETFVPLTEWKYPYMG